MKEAKNPLLKLKSLLDERNCAVWKREDLESFLRKNHSSWTTGRLTENDAIDLLIQEDSLEIVQIEQTRGVTIRYALPYALPEELVLSLRPASYLSHYTAMQYLGLTNNIPKIIYSNLEQFKPRTHEKPVLEQLNVDKAFARPMRQSNQTGEFTFFDTQYKALLLFGNKSEKLGVIELQVDGRKVPVTDVERTLIDSTVRPNYCGGTSQVLELFKAAKKQLSIKRLISYYKKMDFIYPYNQAIGFYLERAGATEKDLKLFEPRSSSVDFYLNYEM